MTKKDTSAQLLEKMQANDARSSREELSLDTAHLPRETQEENVREDRKLSGAELERAKNEFIGQMGGSPLPDLQAKDKYWQFVWASESENSYPSIYHLISKGYTYVKPHECVGDTANLLVKKENETSGFIRSREMVLVKLPRAVYEAGLKHVHHTIPAQAQESAYRRFQNATPGSEYSLGGLNNAQFRDRNNEILGFVPGFAEQNGVGMPKAFAAPEHWNNLIK